MGEVVNIEDYRKERERRKREQAARKAHQETQRHQQRSEGLSKLGDEPDDEPA